MTTGRFKVTLNLVVNIAEKHDNGSYTIKETVSEVSTRVFKTRFMAEDYVRHCKERFGHNYGDIYGSFEDNISIEEM